MTYTYGTGNIKKNNYEVYIRTHKTAETINKDYVLNALLGDLTAGTNITADGTEQGDEITVKNVKLNVILSSGIDGVIDLTDSVACIENDVLLITATEANKTWGDSFIGAENLIITPETGGDITLDSPQEGAIFKGNNTPVWEFYGYFNSDGAQSTEYTKIGACEEKPSVKTSEGSSIKINNGDEIPTSENLEIIFNDLQVDEDNHGFLRNFSNVDICFYNNNIPSAIFTYDVEAQAFLEATGNDLNKTIVNVKLETDNVDNHLTIYAAT